MSIYDWSATLKTHRQCVGDTSRTDTYASAISEIVHAGDVVVDVGTGTGLLAIMACRAGAKIVYAIEPDQIIEAARQICVANGLEEQIVFFRSLSYDVILPEIADVFIAGHIHNFGLETRLLSSVIDAQKRFLKPSASIIPRAVELQVVPVELQSIYEEGIGFWERSHSAVDYSSVRELAVETCYMADIHESSFLSQPASVIRLRLDQLDGTFVSGHASFLLTREGVLHGIGGWCVAELSRGVTLSNNPVAPSAHWAQIFFPIGEPIVVKTGDRVKCVIDTNDGAIWRWRVEIWKASDRTSSERSPDQQFDHATFRPSLLSREILRKD